jgi:glyoxylase-like metal-dependent hydrolase (beta-lactamase superfamily II)
MRLINTHCHIDHVLGNAFVSKKWDLPLEAHQQEESVLAAAPQLAQAYALPYRPSPPISRYIAENDHITFGHTTMQVLLVPGHSPGHIALYNKTARWVVGGDVLFKGSIGRYDLPGGDLDVLMESITTKMLTLPPDVKVYTGHGPTTTIGEEKRTNPFILQYAVQ